MHNLSSSIIWKHATELLRRQRNFIFLLEIKERKLPTTLGNSLAIQWLGLRTLTAQEMGSIPSLGTNTPQATTGNHESFQRVRSLPRVQKEKAPCLLPPCCLDPTAHSGFPPTGTLHISVTLQHKSRPSMLQVQLRILTPAWSSSALHVTTSASVWAEAKADDRVQYSWQDWQSHLLGACHHSWRPEVQKLESGQQRAARVLLK